MFGHEFFLDGSHAGQGSAYFVVAFASMDAKPPRRYKRLHPSPGIPHLWNKLDEIYGSNVKYHRRPGQRQRIIFAAFVVTETSLL